jgi:hypothetical protein
MPTKILFNGTRKFDARPDRIDFRDLPYRARLVSLPNKYPTDRLIADWLPIYRDSEMILNQGEEGSCTGFGLAGVVNYLRWDLVTGKVRTTPNAHLGPVSWAAYNRAGTRVVTASWDNKAKVWDAIGAKAFGFQVVWVNRQQAPLDELGVTPDLEVRNLGELAQALGR